MAGTEAGHDGLDGWMGLAALAVSSGRPAFFVRVIAGLAITVAAALAVALGWR